MVTYWYNPHDRVDDDDDDRVEYRTQYRPAARSQGGNYVSFF